MKIGDLFLELNLGGDDKVKASLKSVKDALSNIVAPDLDFKNESKTLGFFKSLSESLKQLGSQFKSSKIDYDSLQDSLEKKTGKKYGSDFLKNLHQKSPQEFDQILSENKLEPKLFKRPESLKGFKDKADDAKKNLKDFFDQKPPDKTDKSLKEVETGLKGISAVSFEAKAAILGSMYALERLFASSNQTGVGLKNFTALTGVSAQTLQQYQYAARQVGVSNEEVQSTFEGLQSLMTKQKLGLGGPGKFAEFAATMGGITAQDIDKFIANPELLIQKLQDYAKKEKRVGVRNEVISSFVGKGFAGALVQNAFTPEILGKAPTYSDKEIQAIAKGAAVWRNLGVEIEMAIGRFNAKHGEQLASIFKTIVDLGLRLTGIALDLVRNFAGMGQIKDIFKDISTYIQFAFANVQTAFKPIADFIFKADGLADSFKTLYNNIIIFDSIKSIFTDIINIFQKMIDILSIVGSKIFKIGSDFKAFEVIGKTISAIFEGIATTVNGVSIVLDKLDTYLKGGKEGEAVKEQTTDFFKELPSVFSEMLKSINPLNQTQSATATGVPPLLKLVVPEAPNLQNINNNIVPKTSTSTTTSTSNTFNVHQSLKFGTDASNNPKQAATEMKKAVNDAFRQFSSQIQGS